MNCLVFKKKYQRYYFNSKSIKYDKNNLDTVVNLVNKMLFYNQKITWTFYIYHNILILIVEAFPKVVVAYS